MRSATVALPCYGSAMVRKSNWSRRLSHSVTPLDGERIVLLADNPR
jgi:hypothetical protein